MAEELLDFSPAGEPTLLSDCADAWFDMGVGYAQCGEITPLMHIDASCSLDLVVARADEIADGLAEDWDGPVKDFHKRFLAPWRTYFWRRFDAGVLHGHELMRGREAS